MGKKRHTGDIFVRLYRSHYSKCSHQEVIVVGGMGAVAREVIVAGNLFLPLMV